MAFTLIRGQSMLIYAQQEETVDEICWRYYGRTQQAVEQVYAANPGLAEQGPTLPHGCRVVLPELPQAATGETLNLWD
ncbi:Tail protein X [Pantoea ananatis]|nr:Tail protein X [Pantoea ananatis]CRH35846.1 Tail protein X [Pantoea ananatis]CRH39921.1 Tail protein X [Pantoea ananatis]